MKISFKLVKILVNSKKRGAKHMKASENDLNFVFFKFNFLLQ